jgi:hypothetical protein
MAWADRFRWSAEICRPQAGPHVFNRHIRTDGTRAPSALGELLKPSPERGAVR